MYLTIVELVEALRSSARLKSSPNKGENLSESSVSVINNEKSMDEDESMIRVSRRGVWTAWEQVAPWTSPFHGFSVRSDIDEVRNSLPHIKVLLYDLWEVGAKLFIPYIMARLGHSLIPTLRLAQTQHFMEAIERLVNTRQINMSDLGSTLAFRATLSVVDWLLRQVQYSTEPRLQRRFLALHQRRALAMHLRLDLPALEDPDVKAAVNAASSRRGGAWRIAEQLFGVSTLLLSLSSQVGFAMNLSLRRPGGGIILGLSVVEICLMNSTFGPWGGRTRSLFAKVTNESFIRLDALQSCATSRPLKKEILGNNAASFIQQEYDTANEELKNVDLDANPSMGLSSYLQLSVGPRSNWQLSDLFQSMIPDFVLVFLGLRIAFGDGNLKFSNIAILQETAKTLAMTVLNLHAYKEQMLRAFRDVKSLYEVDHIQGLLQDGSQPFPPEECRGTPGMKVEFKNVTFTYPGKKAPAIKGLSFTIRPGALCVIVGENGCGKSTAVKLLSRLYDATEGQILLDGQLIKDCRISDVRAACSTTHQDYAQFRGFSLADNIGFGNVNRFRDRHAIEEAARLGGAYDFISKLPDGFDHISDVSGRFCFWHGEIKEGSALDKIKDRMVLKSTDFSGGQIQRLALSRAFMRSNTETVKLLAYDEPSAALDPKAEYDLFERLRALRGGRTMLFVTHRFGHLTKHADLIIYMEEGTAVEQGSHDELLALNGKYAHLYNVQAQAFQR